MKLLITGDWHITDRKPANRTDENYFETIMDKIKFILSFYDDDGIGEVAILQSGDFFDSSRASDFIKGQLINELRGRFNDEFGCHLYTIFGQHDLRYHSSVKNNTPLGVLKSAGVVNVIHNQYPEITYSEYGEKIPHIYGANWGEEIPKPRRLENDFNILLTHRMIIDGEKLWEGQTGFDTAEDLLDNHDFDLIVSGDNHKAFVVEKDGKTLINAGSLMRNRIDQKDHKPRIYIYDTTSRTYEKHYIPVRPFEEIMDVERATKKKETDENLEAFIETLTDDFELDGLDFRDNLMKALKKQLKAIKTIVDEILEGL